MLNKTFRLREFFLKLPGSYDTTLTAYCHDNSREIDENRKRPCILICPGGGYEMTSDREAEPVALRFLSFGYNTFVLRYGVKPAKYPEAFLEAAASISFIRIRAQEFNICPDKIAVCGFSAGGHLAASTGVFWNDPILKQVLGVENKAARPDAMILCYPVITSGKLAHRGSFDALLGTDATPEMLDKMSLEKQVHKGVPPTFLWHTFEDGAVPVENSLMFAQALRKYKIPFELHIYPKGNHGLSLCDYESDGNGSNTNPHCSTWPKLCDEWLRIIFNL